MLLRAMNETAETIQFSEPGLRQKWVHHVGAPSINEARPMIMTIMSGRGGSNGRVTTGVAQLAQPIPRFRARQLNHLRNGKKSTVAMCVVRDCGLVGTSCREGLLTTRYFEAASSAVANAILCNLHHSVPKSIGVRSQMHYQIFVMAVGCKILDLERIGCCMHYRAIIVLEGFYLP